MKLNLAIIIFGLIIFSISSCSTKKQIDNKKIDISKERPEYRIMFYNVENLFDTKDDPEKKDEEFLPEGARYWSEYRYKSKLEKIYKVIVGIGEWDIPQIVGLCELENRSVLDDLLSKTPLYKTDYKILHFESPDRRGIDVGLLYRSQYFSPYLTKAIPVKWPASVKAGPTRDILYVAGTTNTKDTLHIFVNHWPSRWGGQMETEGKRITVAKLVKKETDSIFKTNPDANIVIMGDLNDHPTDRSVLEILKAKTNYNNIKPKTLYNLSYYLEHEKHLGTHKYAGQWGILDQIIVSYGLMDTTSSVFTSLENAYIYNPDFLLEPDEKYTGKKVFRTYLGFKYHGGYSDHLPTYLDIFFRKK